MQLKKGLRVKLVLLSILMAFTVLLGKDASAQDGQWEYMFAPYLLGAGLDGTVAIRGREAEVDASFGDVLENLEFGLAGHFEAHGGRWVVITDFFYVGLGAATPVPAADIDVDQWIFEGGAGYRMNEHFDLLFGGRYNRIESKIQFLGPLGIRVEGDKNWFDPFIGARANLPLSERASVLVRGDIGGFGIGSDFAWTLTPSFIYRASDSFSLIGFYRFQKVDYENEDDGFKYDFLTSGPGIGFGFHF